MKLNANQLKLIAVIAMTIDHAAWLLFPGLNTDPRAMLLHVIGRFTAPIMMFFVSEGIQHSSNKFRYGCRLLAFAIVSHFAYAYAFGNDLSWLDGTSIMLPLASAVFLSMVLEQSNSKLVSNLAILAACLLNFTADFSSIAVMIPVLVSLKSKMQDKLLTMRIWLIVYAMVYMVLVDWRYGLVQFGLLIPTFVLNTYSGERGTRNWFSKWGFYVYYPAHMIVIGALRIAIHGDIPLVF